jgi:chromate transporter
MTAVLPFWSTLRGSRSAQAALRRINASVVGILIAAFFQPIWTSTIHTPVDFWIALLAFALLVLWKVSPWIVVVSVAAISMIASIV